MEAKIMIEVTDVKIITPTLTPRKGKTISLTAVVSPADAADKRVTWCSSNADVARVDADGNVTALKTGNVRITATAGNGKSFTQLLAITA
jgi:uncharacterized protein YjdB